MIHNFYYPSIHTLFLKAFIILKQEQTYMFLEFKAHSSIYYNLLLKVADFIIVRSLKLTKGTILHVLSLLRPIIYFLTFEEENIDLNM